MQRQLEVGPVRVRAVVNERPPRSALPDVIGVLASGCVLAAILEVLLPSVLDPVRLGLLVEAGVLAVAGGGLALAVWALDRISLGHAALVGVGAYTAAIVGYYGHIVAYGTIQHQGGFFGPSTALFVGALAAGSAAAALVGAGIAATSARAHPLVLPAVTLLAGEALRLGLSGTPDVLTDSTTIRTASCWMLLTSLGGEVGFTATPFFTSPFWVAASLAALAAATVALKHRPPPRQMAGRIGVFAAASGFAGLAGGLLAHMPGVAHRPDAFALGPSVELLAVALVGGWGSVSGAVLAAFGAALLREVPGVEEHRLLVYGMVVVLILALRARGWALPGWEPWDLPARIRRMRR